MQPRSILALLAIAAFVMAAQATDYTWTGNSSTDWSGANNWSGGMLPTEYPDGPGDTATIGDQTYDPVLDDDYCTGNGTMGSSAQLNVVSHTWWIDGTFTVNGDSAVTISGTSGHVYAEQIVINGGTSGTTLTVSMSSGGSVETVADFDCP